nr:transposase [Synechococcus sp. RSCCF101]
MADSFHGEVPGPVWPVEDSHSPWTDFQGPRQEVVYGDAGYQGIAKRPEMKGTKADFRVEMRPGKRRALPDTPEGRLQDLIEAAKAHVRAKVEHPFRVIKQQFGFQKTRLRGLAKNRYKINVLGVCRALSSGQLILNEPLVWDRGGSNPSIAVRNKPPSGHGQRGPKQFEDVVSGRHQGPLPVRLLHGVPPISWTGLRGSQG